MRKIILILICMILATIAVNAAEVCIVAQLDEDSVKGDCVNIDSNTDGYTVLEESNLDFTWSDPGTYGRALCKIEGTGDEVSGTNCQWGSEYWGFYLMMNDEWSYLPVGFDAAGGCWNRDLSSFGGHYCAKDDDIIGFRYGEFGTLPDMLRLDEVKIKIDNDKSKANEDGGTIKDVKPESIVEITAKLENLYPEELDIEIQNVILEVVIEDIDDGDDIEEESDEIDINAEEEEELELTFDIPLEVEDDDYDMILTITAEDEKGMEYNKTIEYTFKVEKEKHELLFLKTELEPETITCQSSLTLDISLINIGREEEDVTLKITNSDLGINLKEEFTLEEDPFDDDNRFRKLFTLIVENKAGTYPITINADYEDEIEEIVNLNIEECETQVEKPKETTEINIVEQEPTTTTVTPVIIAKPKPSFLEQYGTIAVVGVIILIILTTFAITLTITLKK